MATLAKRLDEAFGAGTAARQGLTGGSRTATPRTAAQSGEVNWQAIQAMAEQNATTQAGTILLVHPDGFTSEAQPGGVARYLGQGYRIATQAEMRQFGYEPANRPVSGGSGAGSPVEGGQGTSGGDRNFRREAKLLFPWIPEPLLKVFADAWDDYGDANLALAALRQDNRYDQFFAGNRREDGTVKMDEASYISTMEGFDRRLRWLNLDPAMFTEHKVRMIGDKSANEFGDDLARLYVGVLTKAPQIREYYRATVGASDLSDAAIVASYLDKTRSPMEFEHLIRTSQIGGTASMYGFGIGKDEADRLASFGMDENSARTLYANAAQQLPTLNSLIERFNDPEDELTVEEFADAIVINDPRELATIGRLMQRAGAEFSGQGFGATNRSNALSGLVSR